MFVPENVNIIGSDDVTTCIVAILRHTGKSHLTVQYYYFVLILQWQSENSNDVH